MRTIIYVGGFELPDRNAAAQRVANNAKILQSLGYRVVLIGVSRQRPYDRRLYPAHCTVAGVDAWEIGYPLAQREWFDAISAVWPLTRAVEQGVAAPDNVAAVICYNHPAVAQARIARLARGWGAAALADCTEWYARRPWTSPANAVKNIDVGLRMHAVNRRMDGLITTAPFISRHYAGAGQPIIEIPTLIEPPPDGSPAPLPPGGPLPLAAIASGFGAAKRPSDIHDRIDWIIDLLDAVAARGVDFRLRIIGVDRDAYLLLFPHHVAVLDRLGPRVEMMGRLPRSDVLELLAASAFSFVLRHESRVTLAGFPTKYSESITYGTPCIINALPSVRAYHVEGQTGFSIDPRNGAEAVEALRRVLTMDRVAIDAMKQYCRTSAVFQASTFEPAMQTFLQSIGVAPRT